jgi:WD40-like Beta Propeller Repeat
VLRRLLIVAASAALALAGGASAASERLPGRIVFTSKRDGDHELYVTRADGTGEATTDAKPGRRHEPLVVAGRAAGRILAQPLQRRRPVRDARGRPGLRRVVRSPGWDSCPDCSPDGRSLVFKRLVMAVESNDRRDDLYTIRLDARGLRRLTTDQSSARPSWSRLGLIAFHSRHYNLGFNDIWTMRPDGSDRRRLTMNEISDDPSWSPDGRTLVFVGSDNDWVHDRELYLIGADGTGLRQRARRRGARRSPSPPRCRRRGSLARAGPGLRR